jgi:hypothetical protein
VPGQSISCPASSSPSAASARLGRSILRSSGQAGAAAARQRLTAAPAQSWPWSWQQSLAGRSTLIHIRPPRSADLGSTGVGSAAYLFITRRMPKRAQCRIEVRRAMALGSAQRKPGTCSCGEPLRFDESAPQPSRSRNVIGSRTAGARRAALGTDAATLWRRWQRAHIRRFGVGIRICPASSSLAGSVNKANSSACLYRLTACGTAG